MGAGKKKQKKAQCVDGGMANKQISKEGTKQNVNLPSTHTHIHCMSRALCLFLWICMGKQVLGEGNQSLTCRYPVRAGVCACDILIFCVNTHRL